MIETELKFLPKNDGWRSQATRHVAIKQGYFTRAEDYNVRVRIVDGQSAKLTIKSRKLESGISRYEFEYPIPLEDAETMMAEFCRGRVVEKTRHYVDFAGHRWEVDEFFGKNFSSVSIIVRCSPRLLHYYYISQVATLPLHDHILVLFRY